MDIPRLVIAAPMSGSGKTTMAAGLIAALADRGLRIAPFKVGPDYIDPTYHTLAAGRACRNLDAWIVPPERVLALLAHASAGADIALIEGVMGLFDGYSGRDDTGSTAHIARLLAAPVLLVLDASSMSRSAAAIVHGMSDFDPSVRIGGVLLNRVGSEGHARMVTEAIEETTGIPVIGALRREDALALPERHLGLIPTQEPGAWQAWLDVVRERIRSHVNLDRVLELAQSARPIPTPPDDPFKVFSSDLKAVIGVAHDAAFNFIYPDNLDLLRATGGEIVRFSPLEDRSLPPGTQAIYLCGGFPEIYAAQLGANAEMRAEIRAAYQAGLPIYAECGGLMYLTHELVDQAGHVHPMVGVLPGRSLMTGRLTLGYRSTRAPSNSWLWRAGETGRGHEFHYSEWEHAEKWLPAYELLPGEFQHETRMEGAQSGHLFASYVHLHFLMQPMLAARFVRAASNTRPWGHP